MRNRWLFFFILSVLVLGSVAAAPMYARGTIRGYVFRDVNQNGVFDADEEGIPGVYVTVQYGDYQHTYYTGGGDPSGDVPGPGSYGPSALQPGYWQVRVHVPDGYRATTQTELWVDVPDTEDAAATGVNFGLYGSGAITYSAGTGVGMGGGAGSGLLPQTGGMTNVSLGHTLALLVAVIGLLVLIGTPWCVSQAKRVQQRWW
jgi:hypothetical protein